MAAFFLITPSNSRLQPIVTTYDIQVISQVRCVPAVGQFSVAYFANCLDVVVT